MLSFLDLSHSNPKAYKALIKSMSGLDKEHQRILKDGLRIYVHKFNYISSSCISTFDDFTIEDGTTGKLTQGTHIYHYCEDLTVEFSYLVTLF